MNKNNSVWKLATTLNLIAALLENYETVAERLPCHVDEYADVTHNKQAGADIAIANVKYVTRLIREAGELTRLMLDSALIRDIEAALIVAHEAIGQADVPADMALLDGDSKEAIRIAGDGLLRAYERCGRNLETLSASYQVESTRGSDTSQSLITGAMAAEKYHVSERTLSRRIGKDLTDHRPPDHHANAALLLDEREIAARFPKR